MFNYINIGKFVDNKKASKLKVNGHDLMQLKNITSDIHLQNVCTISENMGRMVAEVKEHINKHKMDLDIMIDSLQKKSKFFKIDFLLQY